jgi:hypothetical protein
VPLSPTTFGKRHEKSAQAHEMPQHLGVSSTKPQHNAYGALNQQADRAVESKKAQVMEKSIHGVLCNEIRRTSRQDRKSSAGRREKHLFCSSYFLFVKHTQILLLDEGNSWQTGAFVRQIDILRTSHVKNSRKVSKDRALERGQMARGRQLRCLAACACCVNQTEGPRDTS